MDPRSEARLHELLDSAVCPPDLAAEVLSASWLTFGMWFSVVQLEKMLLAGHETAPVGRSDDEHLVVAAANGSEQDCDSA